MKLGQVRPATQANRFYTGDAEELENEVKALKIPHLPLVKHYMLPSR